MAASRFHFRAGNQPGFDSAPIAEVSIQEAVVVGDSIPTASPFLKQPVFFTSTEWRSLNVSSYFDRGGPMPSAKVIGNAPPLRNTTSETVSAVAAAANPRVPATAESAANRRQLAREMRRLK